MRNFERITGAHPAHFGKPDASLQEFFAWWVANAVAIMQAPIDGITYVGNGPALVVFREPPFQVQLFICLPLTDIPEHTHPNVESFEINVSGDVHFKVEGLDVFPARVMRDERYDGSGVSRTWGYATHVGAGVKHSASIGHRGGSFLSVQKWLQGAPTSVDNDWDGQAMTRTHAMMQHHIPYRPTAEEIGAPDEEI